VKKKIHSKNLDRKLQSQYQQRIRKYMKSMQSTIVDIEATQEDIDGVVHMKEGDIMEIVGVLEIMREIQELLQLLVV
jgi:ABC-type sugar transport system ATPase subunit